MSNPAGSSNSDGDFEAQLERLGALCAKLDREEVSLAEGMRLYEEGVRIAKKLEQQLADTERKLERLANKDLSDTTATPRLQLFEEQDEATAPESGNPPE